MNFKNLNEALFPKRIKWIDRNGYIKLSNGLIIKVMLTSRGNKGIYTGYKVSVISKTNGIVDGKFFNFKEFIVTLNKEDKDKLIYLNTDEGVGTKDIFNVPTTSESVKYYTNTVYEYINLFE